MNTRLALLTGTLAAFSMLTPAFAAPPSAASPQADTPAVAVVREFLADRATGRYAAAYALLSADAFQMIPQDWFLAGSPPPKSMLAQMATSLQSLSILLYDTHNTLNRTFTATGPDPALPGAVLVRADPPSFSLSLTCRHR